jgi:hypothetical protein
VDCKYQKVAPNIFCFNDRLSSPVWKGIIWAAKAAKMGFKWKIGKGDKVLFWEDQWFGSCSLAIQYREIYSIVNEHGYLMRNLWDGSNLRCTFRKTVDTRLMNLWLELKQIASSLPMTKMPLYGSLNHREGTRFSPCMP